MHKRGRRINEQLERGGAQVHVAQTGDAGRLGDLAWRVLWPDRESHGMEPGNERSVTVLFTGDGIRSLFLGDLDERAQDALLETGRVPRVDVVKVAHHGSGDQAEPLYAHIVAAIGLISVGESNGARLEPSLIDVPPTVMSSTRRPPSLTPPSL